MVTIRARDEDVDEKSTPHRFPTGVDAIRLVVHFQVRGRLTGFRVIEDRQFINGLDINTWLYFNEGQPVRGVASLWRDEFLQVRIARGGSEKGQGRVLCWLSFNPARLLHGTNARPVNAQELQRALQEAERRLLKQGLIVDLRFARLSRIEIARDIAVPRPIQRYLTLLHRLDTSHNTRGRNFKDGLWRGNKSVTLALYDKQREMMVAFQKAHRRRRAPSASEVPGLDWLSGPQTMRLEWRLRNTEAVRRHLKMRSVQELLARFAELSGLLDHYLTTALFADPLPAHTRVPELSAPATPRQDSTDLLYGVQGEEGRLKELLAIVGYDHMIDQLGWRGAHKLAKEAFTAHAKPSALTRSRQKLRSWRLTYLRSHRGVPYAQLYVELHRATFARQVDDDDAIGAPLPLLPGL